MPVVLVWDEVQVVSVLVLGSVSLDGLVHLVYSYASFTNIRTTCGMSFSHKKMHNHGKVITCLWCLCCYERWPR